MNPYEKLDHEHRAWSVEETAAFLGYSTDHLRRLMRQGKMDGCWMKVEGGRPVFCPAKLKIWMEERFNSKGQRHPNGKVPMAPDKRDANSIASHAGEDDEEGGYVISQETGT